MHHVKRIIVIIVGFTLLIVGIVMVVLPGPAIVVIPFALAILATEFVWARRLLNVAKKRFSRNSGSKMPESSSNTGEAEKQARV